MLIMYLPINNLIAYFTSNDSVTNSFTIDAEYTIIFDSNTGTGTMKNQVISYNVGTNLSANTFTKEDYAFWHWNTAPDDSGTTYEDGEEVNNLASTSGEIVTLYAIYSRERYFVGTLSDVKITIFE